MMKTKSLLLLSLLALVFGVPETASAQRQQAPHLVLDQLRVEKETKRRILSLTVDAQSWQQFRRKGLDLTLHARPVGEESAEVTWPLENRRFRNLLDFSGDRTHYIVVWLTAQDGAFVSLGLGPARLASATLSLRRSLPPGSTAPPPSPVPVPETPVPSDWAADPAVIRACGAAFDGEENETACLTAVKSLTSDPGTIIAACDRLMDGDRSELNCLRVATRAALPPSPATFEACDQAMDGDRSGLACLKLCAKATRDPAPIVLACDKSASGDPAKLACIRLGLAR